MEKMPKVKSLSYKKYLRISANQIIEHRKSCRHVELDKIVYYLRCTDCGSHIPFRDTEDIQDRGFMTDCSHLTLEHEVSL